MTCTFQQPCAVFAEPRRCSRAGLAANCPYSGMKKAFIKEMCQYTSAEDITLLIGCHEEIYSAHCTSFGSRPIKADDSSRLQMVSEGTRELPDRGKRLTGGVRGSAALKKTTKRNRAKRSHLKPSAPSVDGLFRGRGVGYRGSFGRIGDFFKRG